MARKVDESAEHVANGFEDAWKHLNSARKERQILAECWKSLCDSGGFESRLFVEDSQTGRLDVFTVWPQNSKHQANEAASRFAQEVKSAFDTALLTAARTVSGVVQAPDPKAHRMPLFMKPDEMSAHLEQGGLRGLRPDQIGVVRQFQPYRVTGGEETEEPIRRLMEHLAWMVDPTRDPDRTRVGVWAHSSSPEIDVEAPGKLIRCESTGDRVLDEVQTVARFWFANAASDQIRGNPNIAFDFIFNDEPYPDDRDDNMRVRSGLLVSAASEFLRAMERSVGARPPLRSRPRPISSQVTVKSGTPWEPLDLQGTPEGAEINSALAKSDLGLASYTDADGNMTVLLRSGDLVFGRPIPPAIQLDGDLSQGTAAEEATLVAADMWGLPDFVMRPQFITKGPGIREVGDGTIITGRRGLAVQVKSRTSPTNGSLREERWVQKRAIQGAKQAGGTIRFLRSTPVDLINGRGRVVRCNGSTVDWVGVVVIDHDSPPESLIELPATMPPTVVLTRRDWDFLFDQLRSVSAVVDYVHRVSTQQPPPLGSESLRYYELAQADEDASERPPAPWTKQIDAQPLTRPLLPKAPATSEDTTGHAVFRVILEDIATSTIDNEEAERLETLAMLDRFSVGERAGLGRLLLTYLDEVMEGPDDTTTWRFRRVIQDDGSLHLAFGVCSHFTELHREAFTQWAMLRHHEFTEMDIALDTQPPSTVAVLLTPRHDGYRPWDTTMVSIRDQLDLTPEELTAFRVLWNESD